MAIAGHGEFKDMTRRGVSSRQKHPLFMEKNRAFPLDARQREARTRRRANLRVAVNPAIARNQLLQPRLRQLLVSRRPNPPGWLLLLRQNRQGAGALSSDCLQQEKIRVC